MYRCVKDSCSEVVQHLHSLRNTSEAYYKCRVLFNEERPPVLTDSETRDTRHHRDAARFLYLNRTCFRGIYRENSKGGFNVPYGNYKKEPHTTAPFLKNIRTMSDYLQVACPKEGDITSLDFKKVITNLTPNDVCYCDPPYAPLTKTQFTKYTKGGFNASDHERLNVLLRASCCPVVLSNSPAKTVVEFWEGAEGATVEQFYVNRRVRVYRQTAKVAAATSAANNELIVTYNLKK